MDKELVFLVVLDDSDEVSNALRYASQRSSINNGRVALLYTFETLEFSHWKAVEDIAEVESICYEIYSKEPKKIYYER